MYEHGMMIVDAFSTYVDGQEGTDASPTCAVAKATNARSRDVIIIIARAVVHPRGTPTGLPLQLRRVKDSKPILRVMCV